MLKGPLIDVHPGRGKMGCLSPLSFGPMAGEKIRVYFFLDSIIIMIIIILTIMILQILFRKNL